MTTCECGGRGNLRYKERNFLTRIKRREEKMSKTIDCGYRGKQ
jgi:hypothetical protein